MESPCDESRMIAFTPVSARLCARILSVSRVPTAAPHSNLPLVSRDGNPDGGLLRHSFTLSRVNNPIRHPFSSTIGSLPRLDSIRMLSFSLRLFVENPTTRSLVAVITSESDVLLSLMRSTSRVVTRPSKGARDKPLSVIHAEVKPLEERNSSRSLIVEFGLKMAGFET